MSADAHLSYPGYGYEAEVDLDVDGTSGDGDARRWVDVWQQTSLTPDSTVATSILKQVSAGSHTFRFLGRRYDGGGVVTLNDPTLNVIYIPASSAMAVTCGQSGSGLWTTTSTAEQDIRQCTLSVGENAWAFVSASGSVGVVDGFYNGRFVIENNGVPFKRISREVRVYPDAADGSDRSLAASMLVPLEAGQRTFRLRGKLVVGGTVGLTNAALSVIVPIVPPSPLDTPTLVVPLDGITICSGWQIFSWNRVIEAASYHLQVDDNAGFGSPTIDTTTSSLDHTPASALPDDTYYWRVKALAGDRESAWSEVRDFRVLSPPGTPVLNSPANHSDVCDTRPTFRWQAVDTATAYLIELYSDMDFSTLVDDDALSDTYFAPGQALDPGTYYWRVQASNDCGTSSWSNWDLNVGTPGTAPTLQQPADGQEICDRRPGFQWDSLSGASSYTLEVDDNASFASPEVQKTTEDPYDDLTATLPPGTYHWRVRASSACGDGPWSPARTFTVVHKPAAPSLVSPADGSTTNNAAPTLHWSGVQYANEYRWEVAADAAFAGLARSGFELGTSTTLDPPLSPGLYYWRVRVEAWGDRCDASDWSTGWRLNIAEFDHKICLPLVLR
jgi:hypothetical protein